MKKLLLALAMVCSPAYADFVTGNKLLDDINSDIFAAKGFANGYISGVANALDEVLFCLPYGVTVGQVVDVTTRYLRNNPAQRHKGGSILIVNALVQVWPCKKDK